MTCQGRLLRILGVQAARSIASTSFSETLIDHRIDRAHGETLRSERDGIIERDVEVKPLFHVVKPLFASPSTTGMRSC